MAGLNAALSAVNWGSVFNDHKETIDCIYH